MMMYICFYIEDQIKGSIADNLEIVLLISS